MADWFIATEGVKVVKDSAGLAPQIITAVASIGAALGGVSLTHHFTRKREEKAAAAKQDSERLFIATELVFLLEQFAEGCVTVVEDYGEIDSEGNTSPVAPTPSIDLSQVAGDWRVLPAMLIYRIRELPILLNEAGKYAARCYEHDSAPDYPLTFSLRRHQFSRLGLKAIIQARRLRRLARLPDTRLDATAWSAQPVLWRVWRRECKRRSVQARLRLQTIAQLSVALQQGIKSNSQPGGSQ